MSKENNPNLTEMIREIHDGVARENTMNKETTIDDWIKFVKKQVCRNCKFYNETFGVCGGEILPIERAIMRNLEGRGNCKDIKEFAEQLKEQEK